jgi:hypothetical protein
VTWNTLFWGSREGDIPFLEWCLPLLPPYDSENAEDLYGHAAWWGHVNVLEWILGKNIPWEPRAIRHAAQAGHLHVLMWAKEKNLELPLHDSLASCAESGNIEVLQWAKENNFSLENSFSAAV